MFKFDFLYGTFDAHCYHQLLRRLDYVHAELDIFNDISFTLIIIPTASLPPLTTTSSAASTSSQTDVTTSSLSIATTSKESSRVTPTTVVTSISGQLTTYATNTPISLAISDTGSSGVNRTALIAGFTTTGVVLAAIALDADSNYIRTQKRDIGFMETIERIRQEAKGARAVWLLNAALVCLQFEMLLVEDGLVNSYTSLGAF